MIQHVVLITFRAGTPHEVRSTCVERLRGLAERVPGLEAWRVGFNLTTMERAWDVALTGEFADTDAVAAYRAHDAHREVQEFVDQFAAQTVGVDFDPSAALPASWDRANS